LAEDQRPRPAKLDAAKAAQIRIRLIGNFVVLGPDGTNLTPRSQKARAILAMLALEPTCRRSRSWLQDKLWSESDPARGRASLRRELSNIRKAFRLADERALGSDGFDVWLDRQLAEIETPSIDDPQHYELLEGIEVAETEFQYWVAEERAHWYNKIDPLKVRAQNGAGMGQHERLDTDPVLPGIVVSEFESLKKGGDSLALAHTLRSEVEFLLSCVQGTFRLLDGRHEVEPKTNYFLDAHVRAGEPAKVLAFLRSAANGETVWSGRVESTGETGDAIEESLARGIIEGIQSTLSDGYWVVQEGIGDTSIQAWEFYSRARSYETLARRQNLSRAIQYYTRALEIDPAFFQARVSLALCLIDGVRLGWGESSEENALRMAERHLAQVSDEFSQHPKVGALRAFISAANGEFESAKNEFARLLENSPTSPEMVAYYGALCGYSGDIDAEIAACKHALSLTKHPPIWIRTNLALAHVQLGEPDIKALLEPVLAADPQNVRALVAQTTALVLAGRDADASKSADRITAADPLFRPQHWRSPRFFSDLRFHKVVADALEIAFARSSVMLRK
jgi:DNA-binding SARP family transcriptional activator